MIIIKTQKAIELMKIAGEIGGKALAYGGTLVKPGVSTKDIDTAIHDYIVSQGATPSFLNYNGFKGSACISVNEEVIHGIPSKKKILEEGDIVKLDVGAFINGYHSDNAATFAVGEIDEDVKKFVEVTRKSLDIGAAQARDGNRVGDISNAIETYVRSFGYGLLQDYTGHGVGKNLHEDPSVPNVGKAGRGPRLQSGMVIAIEPMTTMEGDDVKVLANDWTVVTKSGSKGAHFEYTIAITDDEPEILTPVYY